MDKHHRSICTGSHEYRSSVAHARSATSSQLNQLDTMQVTRKILYGPVKAVRCHPCSPQRSCVRLYDPEICSGCQPHRSDGRLTLRSSIAAVILVTAVEPYLVYRAYFLMLTGCLCSTMIHLRAISSLALAALQVVAVVYQQISLPISAADRISWKDCGESHCVCCDAST